MKVLLIEDSRDMAALATMFCEKAGHTVVHVVGVLRVRDNKLVGISADITQVEIDLSDIEVALVDGMLKPTALRGLHYGWDIIPQLTRGGSFPCIGMSSEDNFNRRLVKAGAEDSVLKDRLFDSLIPTIQRVTSAR
jgi:hypothetical protein